MTNTKFIYPSSFNNCILSCNKNYNQSQNILYFVNSCDTLYVQLGFTEKMYNQGETQFYCDHMQAREGGFPFIVFKDILKYKNESLSNKSRIERFELLKSILHDTTLLDTNVTLNEYKLNIIPLFEYNQINQVFDNIIPNMYGITFGVEFFSDDTFNAISNCLSNSLSQSQSKTQQFIMRKTVYPDVYELYKDGIEKIDGNNIAFIPNMELSNKLSKLLSKKNSIKIECIFNTERQKWTPIAF